MSATKQQLAYLRTLDRRRDEAYDRLQDQLDEARAALEAAYLLISHSDMFVRTEQKTNCLGRIQAVLAKMKEEQPSEPDTNNCLEPKGK